MKKIFFFVVGAFVCFANASSAQITNGPDDLVMELRPGKIGFERANMYLPSEALATEDGIFVEGMLVGFTDDLIPYADGRHEIELRDFPTECIDERVYLTIDVEGEKLAFVDQRFKSPCREIVSWDAPQIRKIAGKEIYYIVTFAEPTFREIEGGVVAPAMYGEILYVALTVRSDPQDSEIYLNNVKLEYRTNVRLSVPYLEGDEEKRFLIRQEGLVNCYGTFLLPATRHTVDCKHRAVR